MNKKIGTVRGWLALLLTVCMLLLPAAPALAAEDVAAEAPAESGAAPLPFTDVAADDPAYDAIAFAYENGLFRGTGAGVFDPDAGMNRAMAVTVLYRLVGEPGLEEPVPEVSFTDVALESWYGQALTWASAGALVRGYGDGQFRPLEAVTVEQMAAMLCRIAGYGEFDAAAYGLTVPEGVTVSPWAENPVLCAMALGLVDSGTEDFTAPLSRRECAVLCANFLEAMTPPEVERSWLNPEVPGAVTAEAEFRAQDHFAAAVNRDWYAAAEIPAGRTTAGTLSDVSDLRDANLMALLDDRTQTGHEAVLAQTYYDLLLDWDARNELGVAPAQEALDRVLGIETLEDYTAFLLDEEADFGSSIVSMSISAGITDPTRYAVYVDSPSLLLYDPAEYTEMTAMGQQRLTLYTNVVTYMLGRLGLSEEEAQGYLQQRLELEARLAQGMMTLAESYDPSAVDQINNLRTLAELEEASPVFPLGALLRAYGMDGSDTYILTEPAFLELLNQVYTEDSLPLLKAYQAVSVAAQFIGSLDEDCYRTLTQIQNEISGVEGAESDEYLAANTVYAALTGPVTKVYAARYFTPEMRENITGIINEAIDGYRTLLGREDWLSQETRDKAIEKLDSITVYAVYPDQWRDYSGLTLTPAAEGGTLLDAETAISDFYRDQSLANINQSVERGYWEDCAEVNAFYNPQENSIMICGGILAGDVYNDEMSREEMLGAIGVIIGHELSHAFDTSGAQFDKDGGRSNWWTEADYDAFQARARKLIDFYDGVGVFEGSNTVGEQLQTEAIADLGGMRCMLGLAEADPDFDYEAFFSAYARLWRQVGTPEYLQMLLAYDTHPPAFLRVNVVVMQFEQFRETYGVQEGDGMYLAPEETICVW